MYSIKKATEVLRIKGCKGTFIQISMFGKVLSAQYARVPNE